MRIESAGTQPAPRVNPLAIKVMKELGIDLTENNPKTLDQFLNEEWVEFKENHFSLNFIVFFPRKRTLLSLYVVVRMKTALCSREESRIDCILVFMILRQLKATNSSFLTNSEGSEIK